MKPARTANQLLEQLDGEFAWRLQEIASLKKAINTASGKTQSTLLRAAIPLLYAHWEGFIKKVAIKYAAYISTLGITYGRAQQSFGGLRALGYVKQIHAVQKRLFVASELLIALHNIDNDTVTLPLDAHIKNVGNLNYDIFEQIVNFLAIDANPYSARKALIDEILIDHRNEIAHGEYLAIDAGRFESLSEDILATMRQFKTDIENAIVLKSYLRAQIPA